ncbi:MAG: acetyl-CoA carboxylase carboxyltransferase subunit alpha [Chitinivibrionales bacterium]|nr:acetyl-CoA carboxylase carboxyltransferase subunit alpha [Chitinivibrionales bacterium]
MEPTLEFEKPIAEIEEMIAKLKKLSEDKKGDFSNQIKELEKECVEHKERIYANLTPWQIVQIARHPKRPVLEDYLSLICDEFIELHGDRRFADDQALIGGFATLDSRRVMLIGHNKGKSVDENIKRNFGQARPDGYRKALRLMKLAEKFRLPVITLIDTQGAYPGRDGEERGQHEAIARNLTEMARLEVPVVACVIGEGGSGGAIGIGVGDVILMLQNAIYSVISPEGCAAILWRDAAKAPEAADALKLTAQSLHELGICDEIIPEPAGGAHHNHSETVENIKNTLVKYVDKLSRLSGSKLVQKRFEKYSKIGMFAD